MSIEPGTNIPTESPYIELIQQLNAWSQTIILTVDNRNRLEWLSPLGITVHKAAEALRTLTDHIVDLERSYDVEPGTFLDTVPFKASLISELQHENRTLSDENLALRGLVQCTECSLELGKLETVGWMAGICPGCQAEAYPHE